MKSNKITRLWTAIKYLSKHPIKTLWVNFRYLPFKQAIRLPILIHCKSGIYVAGEGKIVIDAPNITPFMIHIGKTETVTTNVPYANWKVYGTLIFKGKTHFFHGTYLLVAPNATLVFESSDFRISVGNNAKIICYEHVDIGGNSQIAWESQIYDTNFHYVRNYEGKTKKLTKPIRIGYGVDW